MDRICDNTSVTLHFVILWNIAYHFENTNFWCIRICTWKLFLFPIILHFNVWDIYCWLTRIRRHQQVQGCPHKGHQDNTGKLRVHRHSDRNHTDHPCTRSGKYNSAQRSWNNKHIDKWSDHRTLNFWYRIGAQSTSDVWEMRIDIITNSIVETLKRLIMQVCLIQLNKPHPLDAEILASIRFHQGFKLFGDPGEIASFILDTYTYLDYSPL